MYRKMHESGLTDIIPLMCTSALWGQYPVFSHPEFPQGSPREWLQSEGGWMAGILSSPEFPQGSPAHAGGLQSLMTVTSFVY